MEEGASMGSSIIEKSTQLLQNFIGNEQNKKNVAQRSWWDCLGVRIVQVGLGK